MIEFRMEGLAALQRAFDRVERRAEVELRGASLEAAAAGVERARADHPYTDRTGHLSGFGDGGDGQNSHAEQSPDGTADMVWPLDYASFVDKGTSRAAAYPFTPQAEETADKTLARASDRAIAAAVAAFEG